MSKKTKRTTAPRSFIICLCFSVAILLVTSMIMAAVAAASDDPTGRIGIFSLISLLVSALASGIFTAKFSSEKKLGFSLTVALGITLLMLLIGVIVSAGKLSGGAFMNLGCYFGVFALSAYLGGRKSPRNKHRH